MSNYNHREELRRLAAKPSASHKADAGKRPWHLLPWAAVGDIVDVMAHGATKYGANTWQGLPDASDRYFAATMRHLVAWRDGEAMDADSGLPHLAHAACSLLFALAIERAEYVGRVR